MKTAAIASLLLAPALAQGPLTVTLTAKTPLTARWVNAPPGTPGASQSHPIGPVGKVDLSAPVGTSWARFRCQQQTEGPTRTVTAQSQIFAPWPQQAETTGSLLLHATAAPHVAMTVDIRLAHYGDFPAPAFLIDVGDDGTLDMVSTSLFCCGTLHRRAATWSFAAGDLRIAIHHWHQSPFSPQGYDLRIELTPSFAGASDAGPGCGTISESSPTTTVLSSNHHLVALPATDGHQLAVLQAHGLGGANVFVVGADATTAPLLLPPPFASTCPLLGNVLATVPGTVTSNTPTPTTWQLAIPPLPPGLVFFVQHASVHAIAPFPVGTSNRLRIQS